MASRKTRKKRKSAVAVTGPESGIGERILIARRRHELTQSQLASRSGVARTVIAGYEAGTYIPGGREIRRLCEALQMTPNYLLYGSDSPFKIYDPLRELIERNDPQSAAIIIALVLQALSRAERDAALTMLLSMYESKRGPESLRALQAIAAMLDKIFMDKAADFERIAQQIVDSADVRATVAEVIQDLGLTPRGATADSSRSSSS